MAKTALTINAIAELLGGKVVGDGTREIRSIAAIHQAQSHDITFAMNERYAAMLADSRAGAAIVSNSANIESPMPLVGVADVQSAVVRLLEYWSEPAFRPSAGVHPSAVIDATASLDGSAAVGPGVVIGPGSVVGAGTVLCAGVKLGAWVTLGQACLLAEGVVICNRCVLGNRVRIGANSVIGSEGFGYYYSGGRHKRIPHIGTVIIEDDVEIGACTCVDRAKFSATTIGAGTKIDNLVQIAHNVQIGQSCIIAALAGIGGSTRLGDRVIVMGHAGIRDNVSLGNDAQCAAYSGVAGDVEAGQTVFGFPARPARESMRILQATVKLPELLVRMREMEKRLRDLESAKNHK